jgi:hypothetical protein
MPFSTNNIQPDFGTPLSYLYVGVTQANTGFTPIVASVDTRTIYLASAADGGNDANDGLTDTTPKATFSAARSLVRNGFPDHIRAKCGSNFYYPDIPGESRLYIAAAGRSSAEPIVIWWYGDESLGRPNFDGYTLQSGSGVAMANARFSGLELSSSQRNPDSDNFKLQITVRDVPVGRSAFISIVGTDDVEVYASHAVILGDTIDTIMNDLRTQLLGVVGCSFAAVSNGAMIVSKTLTGRFYVRQLSSDSNNNVTQDCLILVTGVGGGMSLLGLNHNISFDDCVTDDFEITAQGTIGGNPLTNNFSCHRVISRGAWKPITDTYHGSARSGSYYIAGVDGLSITECVSDYGGYHKDYPRACANQKSHNYYLQYTNTNNTEFLSNITTRGASHGAQVRAGGVVDNCYFGRCTIGVLNGQTDNPMSAGDVAHILNTVSSECQFMAKGSYLFPFGTPNYDPTTAALTRALWGIHLEGSTLADALIENCTVTPQLDINLQYYRDEYVNLQGGLNIQTLNDFGQSPVVTNLKSYHFETETEGDDQNYNDPERTLGDYFDFLGGAALGAELVSSGYLDQFIAGDDSFDSFMYIVKHRNLRKWDIRLTAESINAYINGGYN